MGKPEKKLIYYYSPEGSMAYIAMQKEWVEWIVDNFKLNDITEEEEVREHLKTLLFESFAQPTQQETIDRLTAERDEWKARYEASRAETDEAGAAASEKRKE